MTTFNRIATALFDLLLAPLDRLPAPAAIAILALVSAVGMLLVFRATSRQRELAAVKRAIQADVFEVRLFSDDPGMVLRIQGAVLRHTFHYLRLSLAPTLWLVVPLSLVMIHMEFHYAYGGLTPGTPALVTVTLAGENPVHDMARGVSLDAPAAIRVTSPAVWFPSLHEVTWSVVPESDGDFELRIRAGGETYSKAVVVSDTWERRSPVRQGPGLGDQILYPSEVPLPAGAPVAAITVGYPGRRPAWNLHWSVLYLGLCLVFSVALRGPLGVAI
jgi:hypothetical protein